MRLLSVVLATRQFPACIYWPAYVVLFIWNTQQTAEEPAPAGVTSARRHNLLGERRASDRRVSAAALLDSRPPPPRFVRLPRPPLSERTQAVRRNATA